MTAVGILLIIMIAMVLLGFLFFIYLGSSSEGFLIEVKKLRWIIIILMVLSIGAFAILLLDKPNTGTMSTTTYPLAYEETGLNGDGSGQSLAFSVIDAGDNFKFVFVNADGTNLEKIVPAGVCNFTYTDDCDPCVTYYEVTTKTIFTGRENIGQYYMFYLPTSEEKYINPSVLDE